MKNLKSICQVIILMLVVLAVTSCRKNKKGDEGDTTKKYVPTQINIRDSRTDTLQATTTFSYNDKQQITRITTGINGISVYKLYYLSNGNVDYFESQFNDGSNYIGNFNYDSGARPISIASNDTVEITFAHTTASNVYTLMFPGSSGYLDIDFDENDNIESWSDGSNTIRISYLKDQEGVFANVKLNPSVVLPFHIMPRSDFYFMHSNQITQLSDIGSSTVLFVDQERDINGNLISFKLTEDGISGRIYTMTYELK